MMGRLRRFLALPPWERRMALEAWCIMALVCAFLKLLPFARAMRLLGLRADGQSAGCGDAGLASAMSRAVNRAARALPVRAACLPRAVTAALMLRRRGLAAEVLFGVAKRDGAVTAHAWTNCGVVAVTGGTESPSFSPIAVFRA